METLCQFYTSVKEEFQATILKFYSLVFSNYFLISQDHPLSALLSFQLLASVYLIKEILLLLVRLLLRNIQHDLLECIISHLNKCCLNLLSLCSYIDCQLDIFYLHKSATILFFIKLLDLKDDPESRAHIYAS